MNPKTRNLNAESWTLTFCAGEVFSHSQCQTLQCVCFKTMCWTTETCAAQRFSTMKFVATCSFCLTTAAKPSTCSHDPAALVNVFFWKFGFAWRHHILCQSLSALAPTTSWKGVLDVRNLLCSWIPTLKIVTHYQLFTLSTAFATFLNKSLVFEFGPTIFFMLRWWQLALLDAFSTLEVFATCHFIKITYVSNMLTLYRAEAQCLIDKDPPEPALRASCKAAHLPKFVCAMAISK